MPAIFILLSLTIEPQANQSVNESNENYNKQLYEESHALIIGINKYNKWPKLSHAVTDAEKVRELLLLQDFDVKLRTNLDFEELEELLKNFFYEEYNPDTRLFIWFSGHGHTLNKDGFLVARDTPHHKNVSQFLRKSLPLRRFEEFIRFSSAKHIFAVFDSCFAGTIFKKERSAPPPIRLAVKNQVRQFLTSGDEGQRVPDDGKFREFFIRAIQGEEYDLKPKNKGYLMASELSDFLERRVSNFTDDEQTPLWGKLPGFKRGDFVFKMHSQPVSYGQLLKPERIQLLSKKFDKNSCDSQLNESVDFKNDFRNNGNGTVTDLRTNLMWQRLGSEIPKMYWNAIEYVQSLNSESFAGYRDWRLPTIEELASLLEREKMNGDLYIDPLFDKKQRWCWSSDKCKPNGQWSVRFSTGKVNSTRLAPNTYVRAVRNVP